MIEETTAQFYQPTDADGNPIGLPIEYNGTQKDLQEKLKSEALRMRITVNRNNLRAPDSAPKFKAAASEDEQARQVQRDVAAFLKECPSYEPTPSNFRSIVQWIDQQGLNPELSTFKLAFEILSKAGLLTDSSGRALNPDDRTGISYTDRIGKTWFGKQAIDRMPADEYGKRLRSEFSFKEKVERLYKWQAEQEKIA
jgi:hypothetical protein